MQSEPIDVRDDRFLARIDRLLVNVARGPRRAAILGAAGRAGLEAHRDHDPVAERQRFLDVTGALAYQLVDAIAEREHRRDGKSGEREPLLPRQYRAVDQT